MAGVVTLELDSVPGTALCGSLSTAEKELKLRSDPGNPFGPDCVFELSYDRGKRTDKGATLVCELYQRGEKDKETFVITVFHNIKMEETERQGEGSLSATEPVPKARC